MQSEELVQEEEDWNIIINEDTVIDEQTNWLKEDKSPGRIISILHCWEIVQEL